MLESVICKLQQPIKYGKENTETEFVEIRCPSYANDAGQRRYRRSLKAMLSAILVEEAKEEHDDSQKAEAEAAAASAEKGELPFTPAQVLLTISAALGEDDFPRAIDHFCANAAKIVFVGGTDPLNSGTLERMHPDDVDMIFATFIANFIMPSLLKSLRGSE